MHEKLLSDSRDHGSTLASNPVLSAAAGHVAAHVPVVSANGPIVDKPKQEKMKKGSSSSNPTDMMPSNVLPKKKVKRKPNPDVVEAQFRLEKLVVSQGEKRPKQHTHLAVPLTKSNLQPAVPSGPST